MAARDGARGAGVTRLTNTKLALRWALFVYVLFGAALFIFIGWHVTDPTAPRAVFGFAQAALFLSALDFLRTAWRSRLLLKRDQP